MHVLPTTIAKLLPLILLLWSSSSLLALSAPSQTEEGGAVGNNEKDSSSSSSSSEPLVPAMFVFGDSLVDDGNNNFIPSLARSNFAPYGIDFPLGPTGRFCNGRTVLDLVGK